MTKAILLPSLPVLALAALPASAAPLVDVSFTAEAPPVPTFIEADPADILGPWAGQDRLIAIGATTLPSLPGAIEANAVPGVAAVISHPRPQN